MQSTCAATLKLVLQYGSYLEDWMSIQCLVLSPLRSPFGGSYRALLNRITNRPPQSLLIFWGGSILSPPPSTTMHLHLVMMKVTGSPFFMLPRCGGSHPSPSRELVGPFSHHSTPDSNFRLHRSLRGSVAFSPVSPLSIHSITFFAMIAGWREEVYSFLV